MIRDAIAVDLMSLDKNPLSRMRLRVQKTFQEVMLDDGLAKMEELRLVQGSMMDDHRKLYIFMSIPSASRFLTYCGHAGRILSVSTRIFRAKRQAITGASGRRTPGGKLSITSGSWL